MTDEREEAARGVLLAAVKDLEEIGVRLSALPATLPVSPQETSLTDLDRDPDTATEIRTVILNVLTNCFQPAIEDLRADLHGRRAEKLKILARSDVRTTAWTELAVLRGRVSRPPDPSAEHDVEPEVWSFRIGGYPVLRQWLRARKGRSVDPGALHALVEHLRLTMSVQARIDEMTRD